MKYKLGFAVEGGPKIGMGHVTRSIRLANELRAQGNEITFFANNDIIVLKALRSNNFTVQGIDQLTAGAKNFDGILFDLLDGVNNYAPQIRLAAKTIWLGALDFFDYGASSLDFIVNLYNHHPEKMKPSGLDYFEGPEFAILNPVLEETNSKSNMQFSNRILVSFGGADPSNNTQKVLEGFSPFAAGGRELWIIIGSNFQNSPELKAMCKRLGTQVKFFEGLTDISPLLRGSDIAICGGGTTMLEVCALNVPALVIAQSLREAAFAKSLEERDAVKYIGLGSEVSSAEIWSEISAMSTKQIEKMKSAQQKIHFSGGRARLAQEVLNSVKRFKAGNP